MRLRPVQGRSPADRVESPYDSEARFRSKRDTRWTGYMVHLTGSCDEETPRLVVHADTTAAHMHEAERTAAIHDAPAAKGLAPSEPLVDSAYVSAGHLVAARARHGIGLVGPGRPHVSWRSRSGGDAFTLADFRVDGDREAVRCPEGKESGLWISSAKHRGLATSSTCSSAPPIAGLVPRARCTRARLRYQGRVLAVMPQPEHEALAAARAREDTAEGKALYAQRNGVEGTLSQAVVARPAQAEGALPRLAQGGPAARGHRRGPQPRPDRCLVRRTPARANPHLTFRRARRLMADFANRVSTFRRMMLTAATLVLFRAGADPTEAFAAVAALDARVLWASPSGDLMAITPAPHAGALRQAWHLYSHGPWSSAALRH